VIKTALTAWYAAITGININLNMNSIFEKIHEELPIFKIDDRNCSILYTPGYFVKISPINSDSIRNYIVNPDKIDNSNLKKTMFDLLDKARLAQSNWENQTQKAFVPECLTIHVGSECNLNCVYCYAKAEFTNNSKIKGFPDFANIRKVLEYIYEQRTDVSKTLTIVYHGSGEPTYHWERLVEIHQKISDFAKEKHISIFYYLATNACLSDNKIEWLSKNINLIGISCDGPRAINDANRTRNCTHFPIDYVCKKIIEYKGKFDIRVTVTKDSIVKLSEITTYLIEQCKATTIRVEPVYLAGANSFVEKEADIFLKEYINARQIAKKHHVSLEYSGARLNEIHGTYCDVLRNTIRLTPDGNLRNCFCYMFDKHGFILENLKSNESDFKIAEKAYSLKDKATAIPHECNECINIYHCSRTCPDFCIFDENRFISRKINPFRCRFNKSLTIYSIRQQLNR
jgi:radical SAM protein with 4Fe4S-binding SPASM domain